MKAIDKIIKARVSLIINRPFYGTIALKLKPVEDKSIETGWTDGTHLGFNPKWIESLSIEKVKGFICHECKHIAYLHHLRREGRLHNVWNEACDYAINPLVISDGIELPDGGLISSRFKDMCAEEIYKILIEKRGGKDNGDKKADNSKGDSKNSSKGDPGKCGEVRDAKNEHGMPLSNEEKKVIEQQTRIEIIQAAQQEKAYAGKLPGHLQRLIDDILEPKIDWRSALHIFITETCKNDYNFSVPNRRYLHSGFILPSLKNEETKPIAIVIDVSGSINDKMLNQFSSEVSEALMVKKLNAIIIYCDTRITKVEEVSSDDLPLKLKATGGGGTSFRPPFEWVENNDIDISGLIYFTDMMSSYFPKEAPHYPVLWAKMGTYEKTPPFGEIIKISEEV